MVNALVDPDVIYGALVTLLSDAKPEPIALMPAVPLQVNEGADIFASPERSISASAAASPSNNHIPFDLTEAAMVLQNGRSGSAPIAVGDGLVPCAAVGCLARVPPANLQPCPR